MTKRSALTATAIAAALYLLSSTAAYAAPKKLDCKQPCVDSFEIVDGTVGSADIGTGAVGSDEIENGSIMPEDLGFDPDTTLDQAGVEALGFVTGDHTNDTTLDQAGVEALGFVPGDHTEDTALDQAGVESLGFVPEDHTNNTTWVRLA